MFDIASQETHAESTLKVFPDAFCVRMKKVPQAAVWVFVNNQVVDVQIVDLVLSKKDITMVPRYHEYCKKKRLPKYRSGVSIELVTYMTLKYKGNKK